MIIKHKVQRKLDPTFQAALRICILCGLTTWWQRVVCAGSGDGPWRWLSAPSHISHLPGRCTCGVRGGVVFSASGLQRVALCCSLRLGAVWCDAGGDAVSSGSGAKHPTPQSAGPPQKSPQAHLSEPCFHFARVRTTFGFVFLSQTVVPKIANLRKHGEAHNDANTWGFIYKLELLSKYAWHRGAGTWTPRWVFA